MCNERQQMLQAVRMHDFALTDLVLYLDSHPTCQNGLASFYCHKKKRDAAACAYEAKYGPLTPYNSTNPNEWDWVQNPWPWELEG